MGRAIIEVNKKIFLESESPTLIKHQKASDIMNVIVDQIMYKLLTSTEPRNYNRKLFMCSPGK